jgi:hypothetical protein
MPTEQSGAKRTFMTTGRRQRASPSWYHARSVRAAFAPIHAVIFGVVVALASGCGAASQGTPIGMSDAEPEHAREHQRVAKPAVWPDFAAARAWPEAAPPAVALAHRRDGTLIHVRVEPEGVAAYRALSTEAVMPDGARVIAWHEAPAAPCWVASCSKNTLASGRPSSSTPMAP